MLIKVIWKPGDGRELHKFPHHRDLGSLSITTVDDNAPCVPFWSSGRLVSFFSDRGGGLPSEISGVRSALSTSPHLG